MNVKLENYGNMIIYKCPRCYRELIIKENGYFAFTNNCEHYKVYILRSNDIIPCQKDKKEAEFIDDNGWMYVICKK